MFPNQEKFVENWAKRRQVGFWKFVLRSGLGIGLTCGICMSMFIVLDTYDLNRANFFARALRVNLLSISTFFIFYTILWVFNEIVYLSEVEQ